MKKIQGLPTELQELEWSTYPGDRLAAKHPSGFHVIIPNNFKEVMSLFCSVCDCVVSTQEDIKSQEEKGACQHCVDRYYYPNTEKWKNGWRPSNFQCSQKKTIVLG